MLDRKFILDNLELVRTNCANRGVPVDLDQLVQIDAERKAAQNEVDQFNRQANEVSKSIGKAKDAAEREARKEEGRQVREKTAESQILLDRLTAKVDAILRTVPNMTHPDAPLGLTPAELFLGKTPKPVMDFKPKDHVEIGERLDLLGKCVEYIKSKGLRAGLWLVPNAYAGSVEKHPERIKGEKSQRCLSRMHPAEGRECQVQGRKDDSQAPRKHLGVHQPGHDGQDCRETKKGHHYRIRISHP